MLTKCRFLDIAMLLLFVPMLVVVSACGGTDAAAYKVRRVVDTPFADKSVTEICLVPGCNCSETASPWKIVNCTFNTSQKVELVPGSVPSNIWEMSIIGGDELTINAFTFQSTKGLSLLRVDGTKNFIIHKQAFVNLQSQQLMMQVQYCDKFVLESNGFKSVQTTVTAEISNCNHVTIKNSGFSKLQSGKFEHISSLTLEENAFSFESQGQIGRHGAVTIISFSSVKISEIPKKAFISALAEVNMDNCEIKNIQPEAFSASQIAAVRINETIISRMQMGAFSERTLIYNFVLNNSRITTLESKAIMAAISNLTVMNNTITEIQTEAIASTTANVVITNNKIKTIFTSAFTLSKFNRLLFTNNVITSIEKAFIDPSSVSDLKDFRFLGNEIYVTKPGALNFVPKLLKILPNGVFNDNLFNQTCYCAINKWVAELMEDDEVFFALNTSFCTVNDILSNCFQINERLINMENFTELVCVEGDEIICEAYNGETKVLDTTATMLFDEEDDDEANTSLAWGILLGFLLIMAVSGSILIMLIKWGIWMKKKGYCVHFRDRLHQNEQSFDDERDMVEQEPCTNIEEYDEGDDLERLKELLDRLKKEMESSDDEIRVQAENHIQRLYEQFSATNNNRQEEETHLYEELGNLQNGKPKTPNPTAHLDKIKRPIVVDYSEPTDAAVHLYSELKQNPKTEDDTEKKSSIKSNASSSKMALRPLPEKPKDNQTPGPSTKY